jgi:hypothetical protein
MIRALDRSGGGTAASVVDVVELVEAVVAEPVLFEALEEPEEHAARHVIADNVNTARRSTSSNVATRAAGVPSPYAPGQRAPCA